MGGLGPGIGGLEYLIIGIVALLVVGPERLPGMLRQLGKWVAKMRGMANEFRASFDEMARQSELDELRKEVEALRQGQGPVGQGMVRLGAEADAAFKDIKSELDKPVVSTANPPVALNSPELPAPAMMPLAGEGALLTEAPAVPKARKARATKAKAEPAQTQPVASPASKREASTARSAAAEATRPATPKPAKRRAPKTTGPTT